jgi:alkylation response protein AidB-like acyl-CoA dehydrogenase
MSPSNQSRIEPARRVQFAFTDEQDQFRSALRRFLNDNSPTTEVRRLMATEQGYDPQVWRQLSEELALPGIQIPEQYGGAGFGMVELCIVMEELGRSLLCAPYFSTTVLAANAIMNAGTEAQKAALLPDLASGSRLATLAITEPNGNWDPASIETVARFRLDGAKSYVVVGHIADLLIVAARVPSSSGRDGLGLFTVDAKAVGVERHLLDSMDPTRKIARIDFRGAHTTLLGELDDGGKRIQRTMDQAAIALANEMVGGAQALLDSAVSYSKLRVQFGRTIGSFQAIKHKLADVYAKIELARCHCYYGAWAISTAAPEMHLAAAGARCSATDAMEHAAQENIQIHGGIGVTWECNCQLFYRRSRLNALILGSRDQWEDRLVAELEARVTRSA